MSKELKGPPGTPRRKRNAYYRTLDAMGIVRMVSALHQRISKRFPESGLSKVAAELLEVSREAAERASAIDRPNIPLRVGTAVLLAVAVGSILWLIRYLHLSPAVSTVIDFITGMEAAINVLLLTAAGVWSLVSLEARMKRGAALQMLHELRVLAHLVDMHQLTKDPETLFLGQTEALPHGAPLSPQQLGRYLDYCTDMLSLIGKIAALYAQYFDDRVVLQAVDEIETLSNSLSRKIWQKIMILHGTHLEGAAR